MLSSHLRSAYNIFLMLRESQTFRKVFNQILPAWEKRQGNTPLSDHYQPPSQLFPAPFLFTEKRYRSNQTKQKQKNTGLALPMTIYIGYDITSIVAFINWDTLKCIHTCGGLAAFDWEVFVFWQIKSDLGKSRRVVCYGERNPLLRSNVDSTELKIKLKQKDKKNHTLFSKSWCCKPILRLRVSKSDGQQKMILFQKFNSELRPHQTFHSIILTLLKVTFGGSTDPPTLSWMDFMFFIAIWKIHTRKTKSF